MPLLCENLHASILSLVHNREEIYISLCFSCVKVFDQIIQLNPGMYTRNRVILLYLLPFFCCMSHCFG